MISGQVAGLAELLRRSGRTVECDVAGESMGRVAPDSATARIRCDGAVGAPVGSVVALLLAGALTVHRLVHRGRSARARGWVVTEGDANLTCDAPVRDAQVIGVVEAVRVVGGEWREVTAAAPRPFARRVLASSVRRMICAGLELHPRLAGSLKGAVVLAMTPLVWWRPYPPDAVRRASLAHRRDR